MASKAEQLRKTFDFVMEYHSVDVSGHDKEHILRVYNNAVKLLRHHKEADAFVVKMAALLHDVDDYKINPQGGKVIEWLEKNGVNTHNIYRIVSITENIGYSKTGDKPSFTDIESKIVYDADKLDAIGAIAVARVFAYGGAHNRAIFHSDMLPEKDFDAEKYRNSQTPGINHFFEKLLKLKDLLQTEEARKEGARRHKFMVKYLDEFFKEQNDKNWTKYFKEYLKGEK